MTHLGFCASPFPVLQHLVEVSPEVASQTLVSKRLMVLRIKLKKELALFACVSTGLAQQHQILSWGI